MSDDSFETMRDRTRGEVVSDLFRNEGWPTYEELQGADPDNRGREIDQLNIDGLVKFVIEDGLFRVVPTDLAYDLMDEGNKL